MATTDGVPITLEMLAALRGMTLEELQELHRRPIAPAAPHPLVVSDIRTDRGEK